MSRRVRMSDVAAFSEWYFGTDLDAQSRSTRRQMEAIRCAAQVGREMGFTWHEIAAGLGRERTTVIHSLSNGHQPDPDDVVEVTIGAVKLAKEAVLT